jgi:hypothetical protein
VGGVRCPKLEDEMMPVMEAAYLRRIGFTVDISIAKEETPNDPHTN